MIAVRISVSVSVSARGGHHSAAAAAARVCALRAAHEPVEREPEVVRAERAPQPLDQHGQIRGQLSGHLESGV